MSPKIFLHLAIEFGPILVFSAISGYVGFLPAVAVFVALTTLALVAAFVESRRIAWFPLIVGVIVLGFGFLALALEDPFFFIIKDTLYNGAFALALFAGLAFRRPLLRPLFGDLFAMTDRGWTTLTWRWATMFALLTVANEIARALLSDEAWVGYKVLATVATAAFALYQFRLSRAERLPGSSPWGMRLNAPHGDIVP